MKKIQKTIIMAFIVSSLIMPNQMRANNSPVTKSLPPIETAVEKARAEVLLNRLDEIKSLDKSKIDANEKKALKEETKSIKKELKHISGGVYLSAGTLIVILLIILILL